MCHVGWPRFPQGWKDRFDAVRVAVFPKLVATRKRPDGVAEQGRGLKGKQFSKSYEVGFRCLCWGVGGLSWPLHLHACNHVCHLMHLCFFMLHCVLYQGCTKNTALLALLITWYLFKGNNGCHLCCLISFCSCVSPMPCNAMRFLSLAAVLPASWAVSCTVGALARHIRDTTAEMSHLENEFLNL